MNAHPKLGEPRKNVHLTFSTLPPSTNHLYMRGKHGVFMLPAVRAIKEAIGWEARAGYKGPVLDQPLRVEVDLFWPDKRKHDVDNIKGLLDALTGIVWEDDGQIVDLHIRKHYDPKSPRVELVAKRAWSARAAQ